MQRLLIRLLDSGSSKGEVFYVHVQHGLSTGVTISLADVTYLQAIQLVSFTILDWRSYSINMLYVTKLSI